MDGDVSHEGPAAAPRDVASLHRLRGLVDSLVMRAGADPSPLLQEAIAELDTTLEELSVALEELHQQHDELVDTRGALETERRYFQDLFDLAPDAYLLTDPNGIVHGANAAALRLLGCETTDGVVGHPLAALVPLVERPAFRAGIHDARTAGDRFDLSFGLTPRDRNTIMVAAHVSAARDDTGTTTDLRWLLRDVTDARLAQQLLEGRFVASREEAASLRERDRWKDTFLAAAAHDLRSPLTVIELAARTLGSRAQIDEPTRGRLVHSVESQAARLLRLIDDLLDLDRFSRGVVTADRQDLDLADLVARVAAREQDDTHRVVLDVPAAAVWLDGARVEQIVANLVGNAVRHTPGGTEVHVRGRLRGDTVVLVVEDDGPGMDPELAGRAFQPFVTRARHPEDRNGTGLGLTLVELFAQLHGGSARVEERDGGGARFVVELPGARRDR